MSEQQKDAELGADYRKKIEKLKETINESLGLSNVKIDQLEKELHEFQNELYATSQVVTTEQPSEFDKLIRLYKAERSLTDVLQQKIIDLEKELTNLKIDYKGYKTTETILNDFKGFFSSELAKLAGTTPGMSPSQDIAPEKVHEESPVAQGSLEGLLTSANKQNKEERLRLQSENQELTKELHYYRERNDNLQNELHFRNQEVQSLKKILHEQEEEATEEYLNKKSINDEYGYTLEEEFELTKEELNTLKGKYLTLESENTETEKLIESYKKELTELKKVLEKKNKEIKEMKKIILPSAEEFPVEDEPSEDYVEPATADQSSQLQVLQQQIDQMQVENEEIQKKLSVAESAKEDLQKTITKLETKLANTQVESLELEVDKLRKSVWKIEKQIKVFDTGISTDAQTFDRHMEVYGILLNNIFNARGYALILDILLKHQGKVLTKKMVMTESKTEPHIAIRVLRELHDSKIIHFDEQLDQIIWRKN